MYVSQFLSSTHPIQIISTKFHSYKITNTILAFEYFNAEQMKDSDLHFKEGFLNLIWFHFHHKYYFHLLLFSLM